MFLTIVRSSYRDTDALILLQETPQQRHRIKMVDESVMGLSRLSEISTCAARYHSNQGQFVKEYDEHGRSLQFILMKYINVRVDSKGRFKSDADKTFFHLRFPMPNGRMASFEL